LELMLAHGADLNSSWKGYRPLHSLLQEKPHAGARPDPARLACLEWLLEHGADPEQTGGWPPASALIIAGFMGEPQYVARLRRGGARMDGFAAAALGDLRRVEAALRQDPGFVNQRASGGLTALQCACGSRMRPGAAFEVALRLLDAGADVAARTKSWNHELDAIYYAAGAHDGRLFPLLLERGADPTAALVPAVWGKHFEQAEAALAAGANPDRAVDGDRPLLNNLVRWGQIQQALWMLSRGASPNVPGPEGWTALHQAASRGNARMLKALLDAGGDRARRASNGETALDIAHACRRDKLIGLLAA
jgi:ankyrin repeat protein